MQHNKNFQLSDDGSSKCRNMTQGIKIDKKVGCEEQFDSFLAVHISQWKIVANTVPT
jgi:hypothetical protein